MDGGKSDPPVKILSLDYRHNYKLRKLRGLHEYLIKILSLLPIFVNDMLIRRIYMCYDTYFCFRLQILMTLKISSRLECIMVDSLMDEWKNTVGGQ